jgi:uncharacterized protein (DUF58 family)
MDTQEILKKVRKIEIRTKGLSRHLFSGAYHSVFKGRGMSFSEVREYSPGDDVRYIDWNVTARTGQAFLKVFEEERELTLMILVDVSKSMQFGSLEHDKQYWVTEIAAVLAFSAAQNHDKVGLILFSDKIHLYLPPKKGRQHILRMIRELLSYYPDAAKTDLELPLQYMNLVQQKRCICFLISDFHASIPESSLRIISKRHEVIGLELHDPLEQQFQELGLVYFKDSENNVSELINTDNPLWRDNFKKNQITKSQKLKQEFIKAKAEVLPLAMNESYIKTLLAYFKNRVR